MATISATHGAAAIKQRDLITVSGTWATADTVTLTMNGKDLIITIGADTSTTQVATAIQTAWNATSRLDSEGAVDATSNFGGQEFGEYTEVTASIDPDSQSVVILTANRAGVPFTLTVTETTAGDGVATESTPQAATGPWHWDNGDNWSGGSAPANDDIVVLKDQSGDHVGFKYGLPNGSKEVTIQHWMSYTGQIGLPPVNRDNNAKPYPEYRQQYVRLDDAGGGTDIAHRFGIGSEGNGSSLINIKHSTVKCSPVVYNTGTSQIAGKKALNICCTTNTSTLNIVNGSVDWSSQDGSTTAFTTVNQTGGSSRGITGVKTSGAITLNGGTMLVGGESANVTLVVRGGSMRVEGQTGAVDILTLYNGAICEYLSTAAVDLLTGNGGTFDARGNAGALTVAATLLNTPTRILDPYRTITFTTPMILSYDPSPDILLGTDPDNPAEVGT